jgi:hypothetical protein
MKARDMMKTATVDTSDEIRDILDSARTIAIVGCSDRPSRTSYAIYVYLKEHGYSVIPVNPNHSECDQDKCYPDLLAIPEDTHIDIVTIFRNPRYTADMVEIAVRRSGRTGEKPVIWTQIGVSSPDAYQLARDAGLPYVKNRCIMVEHSRML